MSFRKDATKIYIGNLPPDSESSALQTVFEMYGEVKECDVVKNYAFVHMALYNDALDAISNLNDSLFNGQKIHVQLSKSKIRRHPGMGGDQQCYNCGKEGHWSSNCPAKSMTQKEDKGPPPVGYPIPAYKQKYPWFNKEMRRPHGDRGDRVYNTRLDRQFRDRTDKPYGDRVDRPYGDRADRPFGDRADRPFGDRADRPFGDRADRPFGDRADRPFGDRADRPFGDQADRFNGDRTDKRAYEDRTDRSYSDQAGRLYVDLAGRPYNYGNQASAADRPYSDQADALYGNQINKSYGDQVSRLYGDQPDDKTKAHYADKYYRDGLNRSSEGGGAYRNSGSNQSYGEDQRARPYPDPYEQRSSVAPIQTFDYMHRKIEPEDDYKYNRMLPFGAVDPLSSSSGRSPPVHRAPTY